MNTKIIQFVMAFWLALLPVVSLVPAPAKAAATTFSQQGASVVPGTTTDFASPAMAQSLRDLRTTGANYVSLVIPFYQSSLTASTMYSGPDTPTDAALAAAIDAAHQAGLKVMLKPHIEVANGTWRAKINPTNRKQWFTNYGNRLVRYGKIGQAHGVEEYCLGTELYGVASATANKTNTANWQTMIKQVRGIFSGVLTYGAQRSGTLGDVTSVGFWPQLDVIGLSAYFPVGTATDGSVQAMQASWASINTTQIQPLYQKYHKPILFIEIGYRNVSGDHMNPWNSGSPGTNDQNEQARDYQALFSSWSGVSYFAGIMLWDWKIDPIASAGPASTDFSPQGKAAVTVMTNWFSGLGAPFDTTTVWWPTNGAAINGQQPFKALLDDWNLTDYQMTWRVGNDPANLMYDSNDGGPHKEAQVDLSTWNWNANNQYPITFTATNVAGQTVATQSVMISVTPTAARMMRGYRAVR